MSAAGTPHGTADRAALEAEVRRLVAEAEAVGAPMRVLGSLGVSIHCPATAHLLRSFKRTYSDIDLAAYRRNAREVTRVLAASGYVEDRQLAIDSEGRRGLYDHPSNGTHVDVFFDVLEFCHPIVLAGRLERDSPTLPVADLLLSKLQIVKINEKDVIDAILLILEHPIIDGSADPDALDGRRIARACAAEWGLWRTLTLNLDKVVALARTYEQLTDEQRATVESRVGELLEWLDLEPKPLAWRVRAKVGERRQWWTDVEEVR
ncbi:MAG: hypothetical protein AABZ33_02585 [Chloroflexota bacterium]